MAPLARPLHYFAFGNVNTGAQQPEVVMASDTELFYLLLIIVLTLIMHMILSHKGTRHDRKAH